MDRCDLAIGDVFNVEIEVSKGVGIKRTKMLLAMCCERYSKWAVWTLE